MNLQSNMNDCLISAVINKMKVFHSLALVFAALITISSAELTTEEAFMMVVNECKGKEGANDDDAVVVINHDVPTSQTQKCLFACFYETLGVIKDNQMSIDSLKTLVLAKFSADPNALESINGLIDECGVISGSERCDLAHNILQCLNDGAAKRNINKKLL